MQKQLFYLNNQELVAYAWEAKQLTRLASFDNDEAGREQFAGYLDGAPQVPSYLLVDVIEEDFQRDTTPHVTGKGRAALVERKLSQLYRDTPFRHASLQGRDKEGRKDDRYLFNALTNPDLPRTWLAILAKYAVPLAGMYSLASLGQQLFDRLKLTSKAVLLVTHQSSGLRQSFFHEGALRFSRLTPLFDHAPERLAETFRTESAKTRQFMASTRLLARGVQVELVLLASADNIKALAPELVDNADVHYAPLTLDEAREQLRVGLFDTSGECNPMYLALLATASPASHFHLRDQKHFHSLLRLRQMLYAASGVVALAAVAWTIVDVLTILELRREAVRLESETAATELRLNAVVKDMPVTQVTPHNMRATVNLEAMVSQNVPLPNVQVAELSTVLNNLPQIKLKKLQWQVLDPAVALAPPDPAGAAPLAPPPPGDFPPPPALVGIPDRTGQSLLLEGEIAPFKGDYRAAIDAVNQLVTQMNRNPKVRAEVTQPVLDTRPTVRMQSTVGARDADASAQFALKITWKP
ncbi:MAG: hypothetical protein ACJ8GW_08955 [Massilia sp.]